MPFPLAPAGALRILGGWRWSGWLWCCGRSCWWCSRRMTKRSSPAGSRWGRKGPSEKRVKSRSTPSEANPKYPHSLQRLVGWRRVLLPLPGSAGVDFQADFKDLRWHEVALTWNHNKDHNCSRKFCFHHAGHVPVIRGNSAMFFEGAGNGPVVITWIGRVYELYSGASLISLVEHCVTSRYDRGLLSLLGFVHKWRTSRWSATKKENRFSWSGNGIMSSFLGRFCRSTLYKLKLNLF